ENRPQDLDEQARLGRWYLERKDLAPAIEHLTLAHESQPENKQIIADLGSAFFVRGDKRKANELWDKLIDDEPTTEDYRFYLETLVKHDLNAQARARLRPFVVTSLKEDFEDDDDSAYYKPEKELEDFKNLIRGLAKSFSSTNEAAKSRFFAGLSAAAPRSRFLPALLIRESLIPKDELGPFYGVLIKESGTFSPYEYDYSYAGLRETYFDDADAEAALYQEKDYKPE